MPETGVTTTARKFRLGRFIALSVSLACIAIFGCYILLAFYLRTPVAAHLASRMLTDHLQHPVTVSGLSLSGGTFSVTGLSIGSPAGFKERAIVSLRVVSITPGWRTLLRGGKNLGKIAVEGLRITLDRNEKGEWNYSALARQLSQGKGGGETFIQRLTVTGSSLAVEGLLLENMALNVTDLSARGTTGSRLLLTCKDESGTLIRLEGGARLGTTPSVDVVLSVSAISPGTYQKLVRKWPVIDLSRGTGALSLALNLHDGIVAAQGKLYLEHVALNLGRGSLPLNAEVEFTGGYDGKRDELTLAAGSLRLNKSVRMHATGAVRQARQARDFAVAVSIEKTDIGELLAMVPPGLRGELAAAGELSSGGFKFSGNAVDGVTAGRGTIFLGRGEVSRGGRILVKDLVAAVSIDKGHAGLEVLGRLSQGKGAGGGMLQALDVRFSVGLSNRMKPLRAEISSLAVRVLGIPAQGKAGYRPGVAEPMTITLEVQKTPVAVMNRYLAGGKELFSGGTATLALQLSGQGPQDFRGKLRGALAEVRGSIAGKSFTVRDGAIDAEFSERAGELAAGGKIMCSGALLNGKAVEAVSGFGIRGRELSLSDGSIVFDRMNLRFAEIHGPLPVPVRREGETRFPLHLHVGGLAAQSGEAGIGGLAGDLGIDYVAGQGRAWIEGSGGVEIGSLSFRGEEVGSLHGRLNFVKSGMNARVEGKVMGGRLEGAAGFDPFAPAGKATFRLALAGVEGARLNVFGPTGRPMKISGGTISVTVDGGYAARGGVHGRIELEGGGVSLVGKEGKTLVADARLHALCDLTEGAFVIRQGMIGAGNDVKLEMKGNIARVLSPEREGSIFFSLGATPVNALFSEFVTNVLPKGSEASAAGTLGLRGEARISRGNVMLDGELSLANAACEIPAQKISVADMGGAIPFSLELSGKRGEEKVGKPKFSREKYPERLAALSKASPTGRIFRIGRISFGGMEIGEISLAMKAGNGLVEITSLKSKFVDGSLLGTGFFRYGEKTQYGGDLLLNDLSLRALCTSFPKIKGYISGRVDGMINLYGQGKGLNGLIGIVDIWTRSAPQEKMLVSKEFLQKLAGKKLKGIFFRDDRSYDHGEIHGYLENGYLVFDVLDISHTNMVGIRDLSVSVAPVQNKIAIEHLISSIKEAATRGKALDRGEGAAPAPIETEFKWQE